MISQLVEAKPEDLRVYLEEAAGISKYKERRRETENRIRHTEENLERLNDIREELDAPARPSAAPGPRRRALSRIEGRRAQGHRRIARVAAGRARRRRCTRAKPRSVRSKSRWNARSPSSARSTPTSNAVARSTPSTATSSTRCRAAIYQLGADIARIEEAITYNQQRRRTARTRSRLGIAAAQGDRSSARDGRRADPDAAFRVGGGGSARRCRARRRRALERRARSRRSAIERMAGELGIVQRTRRARISASPTSRLRASSISNRCCSDCARARRSSTTKRATSLPAIPPTTSANSRPASRRRPPR